MQIEEDCNGKWENEDMSIHCIGIKSLRIPVVTPVACPENPFPILVIRNLPNHHETRRFPALC